MLVPAPGGRGTSTGLPSRVIRLGSGPVQSLGGGPPLQQQLERLLLVQGRVEKACFAAAKRRGVELPLAPGGVLDVAELRLLPGW